MDLQSAMQIAEQVGSTLASATHADKHGTKRPVAVPVAVKLGAHSGFAPMELGGASSFRGRCHNCGQFCRVLKLNVETKGPRQSGGVGTGTM